MFKIKTMNKIAAIGLNRLPAEDYMVGDDVSGEAGILVRSAKLHDYHFPDSLWAIARAGAGVNNIPVEQCAEKGIVVFNTPGANANAVKELAVCALLLSSRNIIGGSMWVKEQVAAGVDVTTVVEKGKAAFAGPEVTHKTLGVVGLGAIGVLVANAAQKLGMDVYGYDPYLSVNSALRLDRHVNVVKSAEELYRMSDYVTIHVPYMESTKHTIDADALAAMKDGVRIINLARGELVDDDAMIAALESGRVAKYVTDFPNNKITLVKNVVALPHLGASTPESEDNCAVMAARQLEDYLVNGNIVNSVNLPRVEMDWSGICRLCLIHRNIPAMLANITMMLSKENINVENMTNKSRGDYAYTLVDVNARVGEHAVNAIRSIPGMLRVRVINH